MGPASRQKIQIEAIPWTERKQSGMIRRMEPGKPLHYIQAWREFRGYSTQDLAQKTGIPIARLDAIEREDHDLPLSLLSQLGTALDIPVTWLFSPPAIIQFLQEEDKEHHSESRLRHDSSVMEFVLKGLQEQEELYVLLSALIRHGDPKLLRAAEINLRSLLKQARTASLPWQSRPPGHFEPPSD